MKCKKPFRAGLGEFGCGQCLPCRINRQRLWTIRGVLEAGQHPDSIFATLTYDEAHHPESGSVSLRETQLFRMRLRKRVGAFRYLIAGEYGERTWRPHYHAILFGVRDGYSVDKAWGRGRTYLSGVGAESIAYVAGYCLKGAHTTEGMKWHGKTLAPEFLTMSRKPGLGAVAADRMSTFYVSAPGSQALINGGGSVASVVRQAQQQWPLGRYLRGRVSDSIGLDQEKASMLRQLSEKDLLRSMTQEDLNALIEQRTGVSQRSGLLAEARARRHSLERKI